MGKAKFMTTPLSTYRVQFSPRFVFDQGSQIAEYLSLLGISHLYGSPYFEAASGSTHGYDIVDPTRISEVLGGSQAHRRMCTTLKFHGLGHIIDVVPNHMAIMNEKNLWWWDVLKNGKTSIYAAFFDVDWVSSAERWPEKVLLPILDDQYGYVLEKGLLKISHENGDLTLHYKDQTFPINISSLGNISESLDAEIVHLNADHEHLHALLEKQNYRLAHFRIANHELGYRRFFDIRDLIGIRVEDEEVLNKTHMRIFEWIDCNMADGLRIDHPDGLYDPTEYLQRIRRRFPSTWIVAEKILMVNEPLPQQWLIAGTTGYDFLNLVMRLFISKDGELPLTNFYKTFTSDHTDYLEVMHKSKRFVLKELLDSELNHLSNIFIAVCEKHPYYRDYSCQEVKEVLLETAVHFPVYRCYYSNGSPLRQDDISSIEYAIRNALKTSPHLEENLFRFFKEILLLQRKGKLEEELALRFQQLTSATMAKGVEDTAFYRYNRFIALNEVGGNPNHFAISVENFHAACTKAAKEWPESLLATTTHDTKRSEDVRARLVLLSEIPKLWEETCLQWAKNNKQYHQDTAIDPSTEYFLYQTLLGAWPISTDRLWASMLKSMREAKLFTTWIKPNTSYEDGWKNFIENVCEDANFILDLSSFVAILTDYGHINSLAQTLIKLTAPGIPDIYQGTEIWSRTLVDPDNRQPVDFQKLQLYLQELSKLTIDEINNRSHEGLPKLWLIHQVLTFRKKHAKHFSREASYEPLYAKGPKADHIIAFKRGNNIITIAPRLIIESLGRWESTFIKIPSGSWQNILTNEFYEGGPVLIADLFKLFPVAFLAAT